MTETNKGPANLNKASGSEQIGSLEAGDSDQDIGLAANGHQWTLKKVSESAKAGDLTETGT